MHCGAVRRPEALSLIPVRLPWRRKVPDAVRAVALPPGERRVAWTLTADGRPVVVARDVLLLPEREPVEWADVERVTWLRPLLSVVEVAAGRTAVSGSGRETALELTDDDGGVPDQVRSAVTSSVAWSTHVRFPTGGGARVVGRRRPGREELDWQVVYDPGTDVLDPAVRARAEAVVASSRRTIG